jgi:hypothetical protein
MVREDDARYKQRQDRELKERQERHRYGNYRKQPTERHKTTEEGND